MTTTTKPAGKPGPTDNLFICAPSYGSRCVQNANAITSCIADPSHGWAGIHTETISVSLLAFAFNLGLAKALNNRGQFSHFLLWHDDIAPVSQHWMATLHNEMRETQSHVLSVPMPIKDGTGTVSMAIDGDDTPWAPRRMTTREIQDLPETWVTGEGGHPPALVNTGLMLIDLRWPGLLDPDPLYFTIRDLIRKEGELYQARVAPEDWDFSRRVRERGGRIAVTRKVKAEHHGRFAFNNWSVWGDCAAPK